jgi:protoheme IX farnesyltransferase
VTKIRSISTKINIQARLANYAALSKFRLSSFVVLSSAIGFIIGSQSVSFDWIKFLLFTAGGTLVTFASNAINQLIEKTRTQSRPLPTSAMTQMDAVLFIGVTALAGILTLTFAVNAMAGLLSALSLIIYGFIYTPLKKVSSIAVFVGAIPGALPPLLGYVAATNELNH